MQVDTLCNYGALLKTVHGECETAKEMYEAALQVDAQHVDTLCNCVCMPLPLQP